jgi:hypothetical protein
VHELSQQGRRLELHAVAHVFGPVRPPALPGAVVRVAVPARSVGALRLFHRAAVWAAGVPALDQDVVQLLQIYKKGMIRKDILQIVYSRPISDRILVLFVISVHMIYSGNVIR